MRGPGLIIFDLDGTLVDTAGVLGDVASAIFQDVWGWPAEEACEAYRATEGAPFAEQLQTLFPRDDRMLDAWVAFEELQRVIYAETEMALPVRRALWRLRGLGCRLAVSSNTTHGTAAELVRREAPGLLDAICGYDEGFEKGPAHFDHLMSRFGVPASKTVFVGDGVSDLLKARKAGIAFVGVVGTFRRRDFLEIDPEARVVGTVASVPALVEDASVRPGDVEPPPAHLSRTAG